MQFWIASQFSPLIPIRGTINIHTFRRTARMLLSSCNSKTRCCPVSCAVLLASMFSMLHSYDPGDAFEPIYSATICDFFSDSASSREGYREEPDKCVAVSRPNNELMKAALKRRIFSTKYSMMNDIYLSMQMVSQIT